MKYILLVFTNDESSYLGKVVSQEFAANVNVGVEVDIDNDFSGKLICTRKYINATISGEEVVEMFMSVDNKDHSINKEDEDILKGRGWDYQPL